MYAGGDVIAQYAETYNINRLRASTDDPIHHTKVDYKRTLVFFIWGTFIGGPSYHYWFNYLNELPALLWKLKQTQQRGKILRAYAYLKTHGIEVKLGNQYHLFVLLLLLLLLLLSIIIKEILTL